VAHSQAYQNAKDRAKVRSATITLAGQDIHATQADYEEGLLAESPLVQPPLLVFVPATDLFNALLERLTLDAKGKLDISHGGRS
jgi:hypothetical protein